MKRSFTRARFGVIAAFAAALAACATPPYVPTVYDAQASNVRSVVIADDALPEGIGANELASAMGTGAAAGGLIGTLTVAAMEATETRMRVGKLKELIEPTGFDPEAEFERILAEKLALAGFEDTSVVSVERRGRKHIDGVPDTQADAVLDTTMTFFGMQKAVTGEEWRPAAGVMVRLLDADTGDTLMENVISVNNGRVATSTREGIITVEPPADSVGYLKIKDMEADVVVADMRAMLSTIADNIVALLA